MHTCKHIHICIVDRNAQISPMNKTVLQHNAILLNAPPCTFGIIYTSKVHHLMIPLPMKQNQRRLICMDTSLCSKQENYTTEQTSACMVTKNSHYTIEMTQKSFLVFISHLLSLFTACRSCHQLCTAWGGCSTDGNFRQYY